MSRIMFDAAEAARANSKFSPFMGYFLGPSERLLLILLLLYDYALHLQKYFLGW